MPRRQADTRRLLGFVMSMAVFASGCSASAEQSTRLHPTPAEKSPWQIESATGVNEYGNVIDKVIKDVSGQVSNKFAGKSFRGITLGEKFAPGQEEPASTELWNDPWWYPVPAQEADGNRREAKVSVLVDAESERIVGIRAIYDQPLMAISDDVTGVFGKTSQEIAVCNSVGNGAEKVTLKYTFPATIVRISSQEFWTQIVVLDRDYVEKSLRPFANAVLRSCKWAKQMVCYGDLVEAGHGLQEASLAGLRSEWSENKRLVVVTDDQIKKAAIERRKRKDAPRGALSSQHWDVAAANDNASAIGVVVDVHTSPTVGIPELKMPQDFWLMPTLASVGVCQDLFHDVANRLVQHEFPPATDKISVLHAKRCSTHVSEYLVNGAEPNSDAGEESLTERAQNVFFRASPFGVRTYKWTDEKECVISMTESLILQVQRNHKKAPQGL